MLDTQHTKLVLAKWSLLAVLLIYVSPFLSNWFISYVGFLGTFGRHLMVFLAYLIFLWFGEWVIGKALGVD